MRVFQVLCYHLWRAAKSNDFRTFNHYFSKSVNFLHHLENATSKDLNLFLYAIQKFPPKGANFWTKLQQHLIKNQNILKSFNIMPVMKLFLKHGTYSQEFVKSIEENPLKSVVNLSTKEFSQFMVCLAKLKKSGVGLDQKLWTILEEKAVSQKEDLQLSDISKIIYLFPRLNKI